MQIPDIDWSIFERYSKNIVYCKCGTVYLSYSKGISMNKQYITITKDPCPSCGESINNARRISSEPEVEIISKSDIGSIKDI